ncbi:MAG: glycine cleavage system aminomethyltransferase GcvT [Candidatus Thermoplasmatota archaeon]|nr:glycine cleavage system aminomethyltransferase GcvT [Candidatus Thermoplasmatota archaeon]MBU4072091.1 glycine cleavage system aminomethyltransferase GcvT [Candidatus Thermoplasmatota archaeon]MBU4143934.1 glycine cleavage system aminomethyltransferase GcvT [Candidatus Thermoplasmatota archaeon]MBU4592541.1 glycine cleavage system aminomethyltransferase GcvT [Candidatus Thermoplasmatota archaeon]
MNKTALNQKHIEYEGKLVDFHGWEMPLHYKAGIMKEHLTVRSSVGLFDVSHMGDFIILDKSSGKGFQSLLTNDIINVADGKCVYTHLPDDNAKIIDDLIVTKLGTGRYFCVPNASMIDIDENWMKENADIELIDISSDLSCIAVQGPNARILTSKILGEYINTVGKFEARIFNYVSNQFEEFNSLSKESVKKEIGIVSGTGYTGEDGFELILPNALAPALWDKLLKADMGFGALPIGLGARDTLRLEAGFLLSGQDFSRDRTTIETNCSWVIKWNHEFKGREILQRMKEEKTHDKMMGIVLEGRAPARPGSKVRLADSPHEIVGSVSSGNFAPSLGKSIALAYLERQYAKAGINVVLEYHGRELKGVTTKTPFVTKT